MGVFGRSDRPDLVSGGVAIVTGAGSGIGRSTAKALQRRGCSVAVVDIDGDAAEATAQELRDAGGTAQSWLVDVTDRERLALVADEVESTLGPLTIVVNNAGVGVSGGLMDVPLDDWDWIRSINLDGVVNGSQILGRRLVEAGSGHIVNVASGLAFAPRADQPHYCATKAAVLMFSQSIRADLARKGVGVSVICPGVIRTPIFERARKHEPELSDKDWDRSIARLQRLGHSPTKVGEAIVDAVEGNRAVVPVGIESQTAWRLARLLPQGAISRLARLNV